MTYLPQRNQKLELSSHVVMTINDHSTQASSSSGEQRNLTGLDWSVQKCEINQALGGQWHSPKQHRSKRLKNGSDYSRFWSVLPAEGRLSWHFCSCWLREDHKGISAGTELLVQHELTGAQSTKWLQDILCTAGLSPALPHTQNLNRCLLMNQNATARRSKTDLT